MSSTVSDPLINDILSIQDTVHNNSISCDSHKCGQCKNEFSTIEDFIYHKVEVEKCRLILCPSSKIKDIMVPQFIELPINEQDSPQKIQSPIKENDKVLSQSLQDSEITETPAELPSKGTFVNSYICRFCKKSFGDPVALRHHIHYEHRNAEKINSRSNKAATQGGRNKQFTCNQCGAQFKLFSVLRVHQKTHSTAREFKCKFSNCSYSFKTKGSLKRHQRRHTGERPYKCNLCNRTFTESGALTRHLRSRVPCTNKTDADLPRYGKRLEDDRLGYLVDGSDSAVLDGVSSESNLETANINNDENQSEIDSSNQICSICNEQCSSSDEYKLHMLKHTNQEYFTCGVCSFISVERETLLEHIEQKHSSMTNGPPHEVEVTVVLQDQTDNNVTENKEGLSSSQSVTLPVRRSSVSKNTRSFHRSGVSFNRRGNRCHYCNRTFRCASYLRLHIRSHTGERPHVCSVCSKSFTSKDTLRKHLVCHSNERNYECGECGKMYKRITHVREHLRIHTNERPFHCTVCYKKFKTLNAMKTHSKIHTNVLPFTCSRCGKRFREKGSLQRHLRTHTGERPFSCKYCGKCFAEHGTLSRHLKAKVPCYQVVVGSAQVPDTVNVETLASPLGTTVLAEFSSVVTDAEHYIIQTVTDANENDGEGSQVDISDGANVGTSFVILTHSDGIPEGAIMTELNSVTLITDDISGEQISALQRLELPINKEITEMTTTDSEILQITEAD